MHSRRSSPGLVAFPALVAVTLATSPAFAADPTALPTEPDAAPATPPATVPLPPPFPPAVRRAADEAWAEPSDESNTKKKEPDTWLTPDGRPATRSPTGESASGRAARTEWYGWQTLAFDGLSVLLMGASIAGASGGILVASGGVFLGASPIVHSAHGNAAEAGGSFLLRGAAVGGAVWLVYPTAFRSPDTSLAGLVGAIALLGAASAIDAAALAYGERPRPRPDKPAIDAVSPSYDPASRAASVGVAGRF